MTIDPRTLSSQRGSLAATVGRWQRVDSETRHPGLGLARLLTLACVVLLQLRFEWAQTPNFAYLYWNLLLAWVPYLLSLTALAVPTRRSWIMLPLAGLSLLFLPNAPYLVTDFIHLRNRPEFPEWADALMLFVFASTGWFLGMLSLHIWRNLVETRFGQTAGRAFMVTGAFATGYGVYLGRFVRLNSWDPLTDPRHTAVGIAARLLEPRIHPLMVPFTVLFGTLFLLSYMVLSTRLTPDHPTSH